jgi:hypothetical protein
MQKTLALAATLGFLIVLPFNLQTAQAAYTADGEGSPIIGNI